LAQVADPYGSFPFVRDGNVPAGHEQLRVLKEALSLLPEGHERFGKIEFAAGSDVTAAFKKAASEVPFALIHLPGRWIRLCKATERFVKSCGGIRGEGNQKDRRCQLVILTEEGKEFVEPRLARHIQRIGKYFSPLTDLEKEILLKILTKLRRKIA